MDSQRRDLHNVSNVEQVKPFALVQVAQEHLHVQRLILMQGSQFTRTDLVLGCVAFLQVRRVVVRSSAPCQILVLDHAILNFFDDRVDSESRPLEHGDRMIVVD